MKSTYLKYIFWALVLLASLPSYAQFTETTHYNKAGGKCLADTATYYQTAESVSKKAAFRTIKAYYTSNNQLKYAGEELLVSSGNMSAYDEAHFSVKQVRLEMSNNSRRVKYYVKEGLWTYYYENGQKEEEVTFSKGVKIDTMLTWYEDGQQKERWSCQKDGLRLTQKWHEDGEVMISNGTGTWLEFYENRRLKAKGEVKLGRQVGGWKSWHDSGELLHWFTIRQGEFVGKEEIFARNGQKTFETTFVPQGESTSYIYWDTLGVITSHFKNMPSIEGNSAYWKTDWGKREPIPLNINDVRKKVGYPDIARDAGIEGAVIVRLLVDHHGNTIRSIMVESPHRILGNAVEKQVLKIKFMPAIVEGEIAKFWVNIPFRFKLMN